MAVITELAIFTNREATKETKRTVSCMAVVVEELATFTGGATEVSCMTVVVEELATFTGGATEVATRTVCTYRPIN